MSNTHVIEKIEREWLKLLFSHCENLFKNAFIPSHNHWHHLRVWHFARELLLNEKTCLNEDICTALIFATFFHDTGLILDKGSEHGKNSLLFYRNFITETNIKLKLHKEIENAIFYHDDKTYTHKSAHSNLILNYLSIADDLDAFGYIGIYRYLEIYLFRKTPKELIADKILLNLEQRFNNLAKKCKTQNIEIHEKRYLITHRFFSELSNESTKGKSNSDFKCLLLNLITNKVIKAQIEISEIHLTEGMENKVLTNFFEELKKEMLVYSEKFHAYEILE